MKRKTNGPTFDFPVVDAHIHIYPDSLAPKVINSRLEQKERLHPEFQDILPALDGTISCCRNSMAISGISISVNLPVATCPNHVEHTNEVWRAYAKPNDGIVSLAALHPATPDAPDVVAKIAATGFSGIKFHPDYQQFNFNDPSMDDIWAAMAEHELTAYLHTGRDYVFAPPFRSSPSEVRKLHRRFPNLKIVAAHLGGFGMWNETEEVLVGEDVTLDLSHSFFWMPHEQIARIIRNHTARRIIFGSDAPWQDPTLILNAFVQLPLTENERRTICYENAKELFNLKM